PSFIDHFECENCSVRFSNLEKFSIVDNKAKIGLMNAFPGFSVTTGLDGERLNTDEDIKQAITDVNESTKK
ncbi:MAG: hypothetical protein U9Q66_01880, partial [Patescibacteria group bacterium]|nr:hypothetical protein [Patescibacteria group bacterium]